MSIRPATLADWLDHQQRIHPRAIELGLDRVREVWERLGAPPPAPTVIAVGGTNGKGSTVAFLESMLRADGKRVGAYTSPHLLRYNERVRVDGIDAGDAGFLDAFERIEQARGDIALTYFEYGTLAALWIFAQARLDVALLEVGLGGRLDAVNIIDADAAIVTTVDLDHQDWLGDDRASIGREKAGIFRSGRAAIVGERDPPQALMDAAQRIGAQLRVAGRDFRVDARGRGWQWSGWSDARVERPTAGPVPVLMLPQPVLAAPCQVDNAAAAVAALHALRARLGWNPDAIVRGVAEARISARLQRFAGDPELIVDVAHNPQAARMLAAWLGAHRVPGRTLAVFGALGDKDVRGIVGALRETIDAWFLAGLDQDSPRGLDAARLREIIGSSLDAGIVEMPGSRVAGALDAAFAQAQRGDRIVAFGSFFIAAAALQFGTARAARKA